MAVEIGRFTLSTSKAHSSFCSVLAKPISQCMVWCLEAQESSARDNGGTSPSLHGANFRVSQTREHDAGTVPN